MSNLDAEGKQGWGYANSAGDELRLTAPANRDDPALIRSVKTYFADLFAHLEECPENYGSFATEDCLMIKPTGSYMTNQGACSREEMCKAFLTWIEPQKLHRIDNIRLMGNKLDAAVAQIRIYQHFKFDENEEHDVAVMTFALDRNEAAVDDRNTTGWQATTVHRTCGAPVDATSVGATGEGRKFEAMMPFAPSCLVASGTKEDIVRSKIALREADA